MMPRILVLCLFLAGFALAQDPKPKAPEKAEKKPEKKDEPYVAIVGATVYPVSSPVIRGGTVLFKGTKIVKVGTDVTIPKGARVVSAEGRHVCPGFVATMSSGVFGRARSRGKEKMADSLDPFTLQMIMALASGVTTAHTGISSASPFAFLFGGGGGLGGTPTGQEGGTVGKLTYGTIEGFELQDPAGLYFTYAENRSTQREDTRKVLRTVKEYLEARTKWMKEVQGGKKDAKPPSLKSKIKPWVRVFDGEIPAYTKAVTRDQIMTVLALCDEFDLPIVLYGAEEAWIIPAEIGRRDVSIMLDTRGAGFDHFRYRTRPGKPLFQQSPGGWSLETARRLSDAGIPWSAVTQSKSVDFDGIPGKDMTYLAMAAALAVRGGASNEDALRAITLHAAGILKVADRVGSLDAGKDADILVMDREPLDYRSFVEQAWVNGRLAYEKSKSSIWSHIRTDRSKGMGPWQRYGIWREYPDGIADVAPVATPEISTTSQQGVSPQKAPAKPQPEGAGTQKKIGGN
jgi:hypothetical protein